MEFTISSLDPGDDIAMQQAAGVLSAAFPKDPAWSHIETALLGVAQAVSTPAI
jgi:hypothetical protein